MNRQYVNNIFHLWRHVTLHRRRVRALGGEYLGFRYLKLRDFVLFHLLLWSHDLEKYLFLPWLYKYYGGGGDRIAARQLYDKMNKVGKWIQKIIIAPFAWKSHNLKTFHTIEHAVDVADRHCDPVALEEFALDKQRPVHIWLELKHIEPCDWAIRNYYKILSPSFFFNQQDYHDGLSARVAERKRNEGK